MKKHIAAIAVALCALPLATPAIAGPLGDEMASCMIRQTTDDDKTMLVQWAFAVIALHPKVKQLSAITDESRAALNKGMADLMVALITDRCPKESRAVLDKEGLESFQSSFGVLGKVAMQGLFADPAVTTGIADFSKSIDPEKLRKFVEAGK